MVLSDNGFCFTTRHDRSSSFETALAAAGTRVIHSRPFHPETCGKIERFHGTLKRWLGTQRLARTIPELQDQLDTFAEHYNHHRRSPAGGEHTPAERHRAIPPAAPAPEPLELPVPAATIGITAPLVGTNGMLSIARWNISVGTEHTGRRLTAIRYGSQAVILDGPTVIARPYLDPDRRYIPSGRPRGGPRRRPY